MGFHTGLFYPAESIIHNLDVRAKLISLIGIFVITLWIRTLVNIIVWFLLFVLIIFLAKVPLKQIFTGMKGWILMIICISLFPLFITKGNLLFRLGLIEITNQGLFESVVIFTKLFLTSLGARILIATTTIRQITLALESVLSFFNIRNIELSMIIVIAIGFINFLKQEALRIIHINMIDDVGLENKNILKRIHLFIFVCQLIITRMYFISSQLEESLLLYGYNQRRCLASIYGLKWQKKDSILMVIIAVLSCVVYFLN